MRQRALLAVAAIGLTACALASARAAGPEASGKAPSPLELRLHLDHDRFVNREAVSLTVTLRNLGARPLDVPDLTDTRNPQLSFVATGPSAPKGLRFQTGRFAEGEGASIPQRGGARVALAPGATQEAVFPLSALAAFARPGDHTLAAVLDDGVQRASAAPQHFVVEAAPVLAMALAVDEGLPRDPERIRAAVWLGGAAPALFEASFRLMPDHLSARLVELQRIRALETATIGIIPTLARYDRLEELRDPIGWRTGTQVGLSDVMKPGDAATFTLGPDDGDLVRPALLSAAGDVDLMMLGGPDGRTLSLLRFPAKRAGAVPRRSWKVRLPVAPSAARATLAAASGGEVRAAVLEGIANGATHLTLVEATATSTAPRLRTATVPRTIPLPDSQPAIRVDGDGTVRVAVLVAEQKTGPARAAQGPLQLVIVDVTWPAEGDAQLVRTEAAMVPATPRAAAAAFSITGARRVWAALLPGGAVMSSEAPGHLRRLGSKASLPLELLGLSHSTYVLAVDGDGLPTLAIVR